MESALVSPTDKQELLGLLKKTGAFQHSSDKQFELSSGQTSPHYFDLKRLNGDPEGLSVVAKHFYRHIKKLDAKDVGGLESGSIPIAAAVSQLSCIEHDKDDSNPLVSSFYVRKEPKTHGTQKRIEGRIEDQTELSVIVVDDVITSGKSALSAIDAVRGAGHECVCLLAIIFRGSEEQLDEIKKEVRFSYLLRKDEVIEQFTKSG